MGNIDERIVTLEEIQCFCLEETQAIEVECEIDPVNRKPRFFIYYQKHYDAAMARRKFMQYIFSFGRNCYVRWVNKH